MVPRNREDRGPHHSLPKISSIGIRPRTCRPRDREIMPYECVFRMLLLTKNSTVRGSLEIAGKIDMVRKALSTYFYGVLFAVHDF